MIIVWKMTMFKNLVAVMESSELKCLHQSEKNHDFHRKGGKLFLVRFFIISPEIIAKLQIAYNDIHLILSPHFFVSLNIPHFETDTLLIFLHLSDFLYTGYSMGNSLNLNNSRITTSSIEALKFQQKTQVKAVQSS